jgi:acetyl-CoA acetyltransferase
MKDIAVVAYCRTGIARATRGALNQTHGIPLTAHVLRHAVKRAGIDPAEVEDVVVGCGLPEGATGHNIARNAALEAGFGDAVPGMTVNRYCGSGLSAASIVANRIAAGEATIEIAAGVESISLVQFSLNMNNFFYPPLQQRMPAVWWTMNQTADFVAKKYGISREAQDAYVVQSQARVAAAAAAGKFAEEIVPFTTTMKVTDKATGASHEQEVTLDHDEGPRPDTTLAKLAALQTRVSGRHDDGGQRFPAVRWRRGRRDGGRRRRSTSWVADPRAVPRHTAGGGRSRGNEHRDRPCDQEAREASSARDVRCGSVGATRGIRGHDALQPGAARDAVGNHERQRRCGAAGPSVRDVWHPLPRLHAPRAGAARPAAGDRRGLHGGRNVAGGVPRAALIAAPSCVRDQSGPRMTSTTFLVR